jgi:hypothetical protein
MDAADIAHTVTGFRTESDNSGNTDRQKLSGQFTAVKSVGVGFSMETTKSTTKTGKTLLFGDNSH